MPLMWVYISVARLPWCMLLKWVCYISLAGWTPLMYASYVGHDTIVNLLLDSGVEPSLGTPTGLTPLMVAAGCGNESVCYFLIQVSHMHSHSRWFDPTSCWLKRCTLTLQLIFHLNQLRSVLWPSQIWNYNIKHLSWSVYLHSIFLGVGWNPTPTHDGGATHLTMLVWDFDVQSLQEWMCLLKDERMNYVPVGVCAGYIL